MNRIEKLRNNMPEGIDAILISSSENRMYFTEFHSSAGVLFVTREKAYFIIDFRYIEAAKAGAKNCEVLLQSNLKEQLCELCTKHQVKAVGTENAYMNVSTFQSYASYLEPAKLLDTPVTNELVLSQRRYKSADELEKMRQAQALTDETFTYILDFIKPGRTEREIALEMEFYMRKRGADGIAFDFIVASGPNSSKPHAVPGKRVVEKGDFLTMDFGADVEGYHSDMTRTVAIGEISEKQKHVYETVLKAQLAGLEAIAIGTSCFDVDKAARDIIYNAGYTGCFGHSLGHSIGIETHEKPGFSEKSTDMVEPGIVMTVEPGIYIEGGFGCRIEDMVYVGENGIENFTKSEKKLITL